MNGQIVFGSFGMDLLKSFGRTHGGSNDGFALGLSGRSIMIIKQNGSQRAPHVPFDVVGKDRKSTRLNSSHVRISYAVFCLKKKNNKNRRGHLRGAMPPAVQVCAKRTM